MFPGLVWQVQYRCYVMYTVQLVTSLSSIGTPQKLVKQMQHPVGKSSVPSTYLLSSNITGNIRVVWICATSSDLITSWSWGQWSTGTQCFGSLKSLHLWMPGWFTVTKWKPEAWKLPTPQESLDLSLQNCWQENGGPCMGCIYMVGFNAGASPTNPFKYPKRMGQGSFAPQRQWLYHPICICGWSCRWVLQDPFKKVALQDSLEGQCTGGIRYGQVTECWCADTVLMSFKWNTQKEHLGGPKSAKSHCAKAPASRSGIALPSLLLRP